jgi:hypothetical protein
MEAQSAPFAGALKRKKNILQAFSQKYRRLVRALVLTVAVLAVIFATPNGAFAAEAERQLLWAAGTGDAAAVKRLLAGGAEVVPLRWTVWQRS